MLEVHQLLDGSVGFTPVVLHWLLFFIVHDVSCCSSLLPVSPRFAPWYFAKVFAMPSFHDNDNDTHSTKVIQLMSENLALWI